MGVSFKAVKDTASTVKSAAVQVAEKAKEKVVAAPANVAKKAIGQL